MKKISIFILLLTLTVAANAQTGKGSQSLGLYVIYDHINSESNNADYPQADTKTKFRSFAIGPNYSYFIANNLDLSLGVQYNYGKNESAGTNSNLHNTIQGYGGVIALRKYFLYNNKIGIRTGPFASYQFLKIDANSIYLNNTRLTDYSGGINADFVYYPAKNFAVTALLGGLAYTHNKTTGGINHTKADAVRLNFANNVSLTVSYVFGK